MSRWLNPPFDARIRHIIPPLAPAAPAAGSAGSTSTAGSSRNVKLKRGYIICDDDGDGAPGMSGKGVRFLYNPVAVTVTHSVPQDMVIGTADGSGGVRQPADQVGQVGTLVNIGNLSIDLLYDRTYELWDSKYKHTVAGQFGVYADVLGFYRMTGVVRNVHRAAKASSGPAKGGFDPATAAVNGFDQYPRYMPNAAGRYYLYFGDKVRWYGTLTDLSITYSHWTRSMVPSRCSISVGFMFQSDQKGAGIITKGGKVVNKPKAPPKSSKPTSPKGGGSPLEPGGSLGLPGSSPL